MSGKERIVVFRELLILWILFPNILSNSNWGTPVSVCVLYSIPAYSTWAGGRSCFETQQHNAFNEHSFKAQTPAIYSCNRGVKQFSSMRRLLKWNLSFSCMNFRVILFKVERPHGSNGEYFSSICANLGKYTMSTPTPAILRPIFLDAKLITGGIQS